MAKVTKSSGNVFEDLGFDDSESENLKLRAQFTTCILDIASLVSHHPIV